MAIDTKSFTSLKWYFQLAIVAGVCGGLLGIGWYYFISPVDDDIVKKQAQYSGLQKEIDDARKQAKQLEQFKAQVADLTTQLADLKKILPEEKETPQIIEAIQKEAITSHVQVTRFAVRPIVDHDVYTEWPWDMEVVGTYNNLGAFFDRVRQLPRIVSVSDLKITSRASDGEKAATASIGATYVVKTYIYHDTPLPTGAPAKPAK